VKELSQDQALTLLTQRAAAKDDLVEYTRLIDIPSVPLDSNEDEWAVVETPLAAHHLLLLHALQAMVDGKLLYDSVTYAPITQPTPAGLALCDVAGQTARGGRSGGGVGSLKVTDPSPNPTNPEIPHPSAQPPPDINQALILDDGHKVIKNTEDIPAIYLRDRRYSTCKRVMVMEPPGSAKSTYASVVFPTWQMGRKLDEEVILTGWGDPICRRHGKRARTICKSELYRSVMGSGLDPNTRAAEDWALMNGSTYKSSGINSGIAGFRCDGLVWDDLTKNRKEADSQTIRNDTYNAYIDDARSRKKPDAWEVGIGTRWHEDEIMGRILPEGYSGESGYMLCRDGNVWLIICLAAECERTDDPLGREIGEMIWPEWFGEGYWAEKRVNPRSWGSLYQQRPAPEEGIFFKREDFKRYETLPEGDNWIGLDPAVTDEEEGDDPDETCIQVWRTDEFARLYLMDEYWKAVTMDVWIAELIKKGRRFKPMMICSESGVIRRASEPFIKRAMMKAKAFFSFVWAHRSANKPAMARGAQAMVASGQVFVPYGQLGDDFIDECLKFPAAASDNRVDAFVNLCMHLEFIWDAQPPKTVEEEKCILTTGEIPIKQLMPPRHIKKKSRWSRKFGRPSLH
jgi:predicted phage terminase large subunit-like protein